MLRKEKNMRLNNSNVKQTKTINDLLTSAWGKESVNRTREYSELAKNKKKK